jgi:hypothetical protein
MEINNSNYMKKYTTEDLEEMLSNLEKVKTMYDTFANDILKEPIPNLNDCIKYQERAKGIQYSINYFKYLIKKNENE